jgi:hypothetical protein
VAMVIVAALLARRRLWTLLWTWIVAVVGGGRLRQQTQPLHTHADTTLRFRKTSPYPTRSPFGGFDYTTITVIATPSASPEDVIAAWRAPAPAEATTPTQAIPPKGAVPATPA